MMNPLNATVTGCRDLSSRQFSAVALPESLRLLVLALTLALALVVLGLVVRHVVGLIPVLTHEIDRPAARVVLRAVLSPVLLVARWHAHVDRLHIDDLRRTLDPDRLGIDHRRSREIANVDLPVKARLADSNRGADVSGERRGSGNCSDDGE